MEVEHERQGGLAGARRSRSIALAWVFGRRVLILEHTGRRRQHRSRTTAQAQDSEQPTDASTVA